MAAIKQNIQIKKECKASPSVANVDQMGSIPLIVIRVKLI